VLRNVWFRAAFLNPLFCVGPWVVASHLFATSDDDDITGIVGLSFWAVGVGAALSFVVTLFMVMGRPETEGDRLQLLVLGLVGSGLGLVLGYVSWFDAAQTDCAGRYECPF
jgi:drug/metabolite transporter (DMT)-like permease